MSTLRQNRTSTGPTTSSGWGSSRLTRANATGARPRCPTPPGSPVPGRAPGAPPRQPPPPVLGAQGGQDLLGEGPQLVVLAEEVGLVDGDPVDRLLQLAAAAATLAEQAGILGEVARPGGLEARRQAALEQVLLARLEGQAGVIAQQAAQLGEL